MSDLMHSVPGMGRVSSVVQLPGAAAAPVRQARGWRRLVSTSPAAPTAHAMTGQAGPVLHLTAAMRGIDDALRRHLARADELMAALATLRRRSADDDRLQAALCARSDELRADAEDAESAQLHRRLPADVARVRIARIQAEAAAVDVLIAEAIEREQQTRRQAEALRHELATVHAVCRGLGQAMGATCGRVRGWPALHAVAGGQAVGARQGDAA